MQDIFRTLIGIWQQYWSSQESDHGRLLAAGQPLARPLARPRPGCARPAVAAGGAAGDVAGAALAHHPRLVARARAGGGQLRRVRPRRARGQQPRQPRRPLLRPVRPGPIRGEHSEHCAE